MFVFRKIWRVSFSLNTYYVCVQVGEKCSFFGKFGVLCFLETPVLRFVLLPYYRQIVHLFVQYKEAEVYKIENLWEVHWIRCVLHQHYFGCCDPLPVLLPWSVLDNCYVRNIYFLLKMIICGTYYADSAEQSFWSIPFPRGWCK